MTNDTQQPVPDTSALLDKAVKGARMLEIKRILGKVRNQEALNPAEMKTLAEYQAEAGATSIDAQPNSGPQDFRSMLEVTAWLKDNGWKVTKSTVHRHVQQGKLRPDESGRFPVASVRKYAATFLSLKETLQKLDDEDLNRRKLKCEIERIQEQTRRERLRREIEESKYFPRDRFELELAARAAVIDTLRRNAILSDSAEIVAIVAGDPRRIPDLIQFLLARHDDEMNQYATMKEFHVLFEQNMDQNPGARTQESE